jgi:hypothetical protein
MNGIMFGGMSGWRGVTALEFCKECADLKDGKTHTTSADFASHQLRTLARCMKLAPDDAAACGRAVRPRQARSAMD